MKVSREQAEQMLEAAKPLMEWINENCHPHTQLIVDHTHVQLWEGIAVETTQEFLKD